MTFKFVPVRLKNQRFDYYFHFVPIQAKIIALYPSFGLGWVHFGTHLCMLGKTFVSFVFCMFFGKLRQWVV